MINTLYLLVFRVWMSVNVTLWVCICIYVREKKNGYTFHSMSSRSRMILKQCRKTINHYSLKHSVSIRKNEETKTILIMSLVSPATEDEMKEKEPIMYYQLWAVLWGTQSVYIRIGILEQIFFNFKKNSLLVGWPILSRLLHCKQAFTDTHANDWWNAWPDGKPTCLSAAWGGGDAWWKEEKRRERKRPSSFDQSVLENWISPKHFPISKMVVRLLSVRVRILSDLSFVLIICNIRPVYHQKVTSGIDPCICKNILQERSTSCYLLCCWHYYYTP